MEQPEERSETNTYGRVKLCTTLPRVLFILLPRRQKMKFCKNLTGPCPAPTYLPTKWSPARLRPPRNKRSVLFSLPRASWPARALRRLGGRPSPPPLATAPCWPMQRDTAGARSARGRCLPCQSTIPLSAPPLPPPRASPPPPPPSPSPLSGAWRASGHRPGRGAGCRTQLVHTLLLCTLTAPPAPPRMQLGAWVSGVSREVAHR